MGVRMAKLMPPVFADDLLFIYLAVRPKMAITRLVEVDCLEHMMIERHVGWKLTLIVGTVKAHFKFGTILSVLLDVVTWDGSFS